MTQKIVTFIAFFYFLTFVSAFVMAEESLLNIESELERARMGKLVEEAAPAKLAEEVTIPAEVAPTPTKEEATPVEVAPAPAELAPDPVQDSAFNEEPSSYESNKVIFKPQLRGESPQHWAFTFMGGTYRPQSYEGSGTKFETIYTSGDRFLGDRGVWADLSLEWQFSKSKLGRLGLKASTGSWLIQRSFDTDKDAATVEKRYTLWAAPIFIGPVYRGHFWKNQPLIPFFELGAGGFHFFQGDQADSNDRYNKIFRAAAIFGFGVQLNADIFDKASAKAFDINWGVNNTYIVGEYRAIRSQVNDEFDFSGNELVTVGFLFEF